MWISPIKSPPFSHYTIAARLCQTWCIISDNFTFPFCVHRVQSRKQCEMRSLCPAVGHAVPHGSVCSHGDILRQAGIISAWEHTWEWACVCPPKGLGDGYDRTCGGTQKVRYVQSEIIQKRKRIILRWTHILQTSAKRHWAHAVRKGNRYEQSAE